ncbi:MAG: hypothetical protein ABI224_03915, partial [Acetobacteraceae bacterium]
MATQTSVTNSGTTTTGALLSPAIPAPALATFGLSHAASTGGSKVFDWSDRANWSNGAPPSSLGGAAAVVVSAGTGGTNVDDIASLTISSLNFLAGAPALEIAAGNRLTITGAGTNGSIRLDANATLLEPNSGLSCITLAGSGARVEMGGVPRGYIAFSTVAGTSGSLFIAQPQAGTATAPGVDPQVIQNFAVGDHIYIEEKQTGSLTATYLPGSGAAGTLLISNGGVPVYEFTNFYGNPALNYQVAETAITDPLTGQAGIAALDVFVSAAAKPMNWLTGASTSSPGSNTAVVVSAGASGASIDYFPSLTISSLDFLAGAPGLEIAVGNTLTIAGAGTNGTIKLDANATLLEPNSGASYVNLAGNDARVEMGAVPRGYIQFSTVAGTSGSLIIEQPQSHTATAPGIDPQSIQNFTAGDQIYIEERQTGPLTVTYTPGIGSTGTLLISDGAIPIYEFNNFQGNSALNYQAGETTITDPLTGSVGASALDLHISTTAKSPTQAPNASNPGSSGYGSTSSSPPASGPTTPPPVHPVPAPPP